MSGGAGRGANGDLPPDREPGRIAFLRLWPIGVFAIVVGGLAVLWPQVAGGRRRVRDPQRLGVAWTASARSSAIEERDGVRFYVEPSSAFSPVKLVRTPGLGRDRVPAGHPPPPPSGGGS